MKDFVWDFNSDIIFFLFFNAQHIFIDTDWRNN